MLNSEEILNKPTIGFWTDFGGVEVKEINHRNGEDYVTCVTIDKKIHRLKVYDSEFIRLCKVKLKMSDCIRV